MWPGNIKAHDSDSDTHWTGKPDSEWHWPCVVSSYVLCLYIQAPFGDVNNGPWWQVAILQLRVSWTCLIIFKSSDWASLSIHIISSCCVYLFTRLWSVIRNDRTQVTCTMKTLYILLKDIILTGQIHRSTSYESVLVAFILLIWCLTLMKTLALKYQFLSTIFAGL